MIHNAGTPVLGAGEAVEVSSRSRKPMGEVKYREGSQTSAVVAMAKFQRVASLASIKI